MKKSLSKNLALRLTGLYMLPSAGESSYTAGTSGEMAVKMSQK
jgi:hypothetical protein